jgi:hypothetical protein
MTRDRGPAMERMRKQYLASDSLSPAERNQILQLASLFERASWSLNRFATLLREAAIRFSSQVLRRWQSRDTPQDSEKRREISRSPVSDGGRARYVSATRWKLKSNDR